VGERRHERQLADARARYFGAQAGFGQALAAFDGSGMPMDPGPDPAEPYPWTEEHWAIIVTLGACLVELADARRSWDGMRREWRPPH
jgi:hypothetical protein